MDAIAHTVALQSELRAKETAYKEAIEQFREFLDQQQLKGLSRGKEIEPLISAFSTSFNDPDKRDFFIDIMFYRLASAEVWARQNWHWSFYEMLRQLNLLFIPTITIISFYATLQIRISTLSSFDFTDTFVIPAVVAALLTFLIWISPLRRFLQKERDMDCKVYYRHRAWVVIAYLIDTCFVTYSREYLEENKLKKPTGVLSLIRTWRR